MQYTTRICKLQATRCTITLAASFQSVLDLTCHFTSLPLNAALFPLRSSHFSHRTLSCCRVVEVTPEAAVEAHWLPGRATDSLAECRTKRTATPRSCVSPACFAAMKDMTIQSVAHRPSTLCAYFGAVHLFVCA